uniref:Uncharacterized protein n=1 Tax=Tanacetum cinerariifolium TaxID=118510 RepID=A0A6L2P3N0_TANCI|nr:hypothetical protein [Tanacetum cinerariifolium]
MKNEMKARGTLLMALPNKDQLKFHSYKDAKLLMEAIEKRYRGNKESKKVQRTFLKQQYENFAASSPKTLDQTFDRLQKLISQLEIQGEVTEQEDMNLKLLRSLPSEWKTHALIWRNKVDIETISLDDLYNNLKIYEPELKVSLSTSQNPQNVAFISSNSTNSTNEVDNSAFGVSTAHSQGNIVNSTSVDNLSDAVMCDFLASQPKSPQLAREDLKQINLDDLKEINLHWEMAMLTIRARRYDWSYQAEEEHPTNYALMALTSLGSSSSSASESVEERLAHYKKNKVAFEEKINILNFEVKLRDNALVENTKKLEKAEKERDELKLTLEKFQNSSKSLNILLQSQVSDKVKTRLGYKTVSPIVESFVNSSKILENQENVKSRSDKGYHTVPPPYTVNYIPSKPDLTFIDEQVESDSVDVDSNVASSDVKTVESKHESVDVKNKGVYSTIETKPVRKNNFSPPVIEDWNSDDETKVEFEPKIKVKTVRPSIEKIKFVKPARKKVEKVETPKQYKHYPRGNQRNWNNLMSQRLGSQAEIKKEPKQEYIMIPICTTDPLLSQGLKDSAVDAEKKATEVDESQVSIYGGKDDQVTRNAFEMLLQQQRIFGNAYDDEAVEEEVDMNNVVSSYPIPNAPLTKFIKDHPKDQVTNISQSSGPTNLVADETIYKEWEDIMEMAATTASSLEVEHNSGNINRTQSTATHNEPLPQGNGLASGPRC